jgi:hypothetical protein
VVDLLEHPGHQEHPVVQEHQELLVLMVQTV